MKHEIPPTPPGVPAVQGQHGQLPVAYHYPPAQGYGTAPPEDEASLDILKILFVILHHRWLIAGALLVGVVTGVLVTWSKTPLYRATASIEITKNRARVLQDLEVLSQQNDWVVMETARQKLSSGNLARRVVYELNLSENAEFLQPTASFSLQNVFNKALGLTNKADIEGMTPELREALAMGMVRGGISAFPIERTTIMLISFSHPDPNLAAKVANQTAKSFLDLDADKDGQSSKLAREFIQEQVIETKKKLEASEKALVEYAKDVNITITGDDASLISQNLAQINNALSTAIEERLTAERYKQQVAEGSVSALPQVSESESIRTAKDKVIELKAIYREKRVTLKPGFPEMRNLQAQIDEYNRQIKIEIEAVGRSIEISHQQSVEKEKALRAELKKLEAAQSEYQEKNIDYTILRREVDSNRNQYDTLIGKLNDLAVGADLQSTRASVLDTAAVPGSPYSPRLYKYVGAGVAFFLSLAAAFIFLVELLNNTFTTPDQVESELGVPVLGVIPAVADDRLEELLDDPSSSLSESYRTLRTSLQFTGAENDMKTLLVTSSEPSEVKSSTVYRLALEFVGLGRKVLVIDADLRKPKMHRLFRTDNTIGLSNVLSNVVESETAPKVFRETSTPNLTFIAAGTIPPNPADLLASEKMGRMVHLCSQSYDLVIIDSSPVMGLSDAAILGRNMDAVLLMVSAKQVHRRAAKDAIKRLRAAGANVVGAAMSRFSLDKTSYKYSYKYMDNNYYSYQTDLPQLENSASHDKTNNATGPFAFITAWIDRFSSRFG